MPNRTVQTCCDSDAKTEESTHPFHSMWMARWMQRSCNSASRAHNHFLKDHDSKEGAVIAQIAEPRNAKRLAIDGNPCNVSEYTNAWQHRQGDIVVASDIPQSAKAAGAVTEAKRVEITDEPLVMKSGKLRNANIKRNMENVSVQKKDPIFCEKHASMTQTDDNSEYGTGTVGASRPHFPSRALRLYVLPALGPFQDDLTTFESFMRGKGETDHSNLRVASKEQFGNTNFTHVEHEHCNYPSYSTFLVCGKKTDNLLVSRKSESSYFGKNTEALQLQHNPSTSNFCLPDHNCLAGVSKLEEFYHGQYLLHRMPTCSIHDMEKVRICTTVDSMEGEPGAIPKFSQTTHRVSLTKKTGKPMIQDPTLSTTFDGKAFQELLTLPPGFDSNGRCGVKLQLVGSSADGEGKDVRDVKTGSLGLKDESSDETDTMDITAFQARNSLLSIASSSSNKDFMVDQSRARSQVKMVSLREKTKNSNSSLQQDSPLEDTEPSTRWVKRLKLSASDSPAHSTRNMNIGDTSSSEKVTKIFGKVMSYRRPNSEPTLGDRKSSSMNSVKKCWDLSLSRSWIKRWCHNRAPAPLMKPTPPTAFEPQSLKVMSDDFQRKHFPSFAAMALMGKALSGFRACEFHNRGSFVVWNTMGF